MKKKISILLLLFAACYLGAHYYSRSKIASPDDARKVSAMADCDASHVTSLRFERGAGKSKENLSFERTNEAWHFTSPNLGQADSEVLNKILGIACETYDPEAVPLNNTENLHFDKPAAHLVLREEEGTKAKMTDIYVSEVYLGGMAVVSVGDTNKKNYYKVSAKLGELLHLAPEAMQNHRVMLMDASKVDRLSLSRKNEQVLMLMRSENGWRVFAAGKELGAGNEEADHFVNRLATLRAIDLEDVHLDMVDCDKKVGDIVIDVEGSSGRKETLRFNEPKILKGRASPLMLACSNARSTLFGVSQDMLNYLDIRADSLLASPKKL